ncbi:MAG: hypothetical protein ACI944_001740, partial [Natronomonas sp.]
MGRAGRHRRIDGNRSIPRPIPTFPLNGLQIKISDMKSQTASRTVES